MTEVNKETQSKSTASAKWARAYIKQTASDVYRILYTSDIIGCCQINQRSVYMDQIATSTSHFLLKNEVL